MKIKNIKYEENIVENVLDLLYASKQYYNKMYQGNELHETIESKQKEFDLYFQTLKKCFCDFP